MQPGMNALVSGATATRERQIEDAKLTEGFGSPGCIPSVPGSLYTYCITEAVFTFCWGGHCYKPAFKSIKWTMSLQYLPLIMVKKLPSFHFVSCVFELIQQKRKKENLKEMPLKYNLKIDFVIFVNNGVHLEKKLQNGSFFTSFII